MKRATWIYLLAGAILAVGIGIYSTRNGKAEVKWRTAPVERGSIAQRISATGTLSALIQVNVGTQVSGTISGIFVDYNAKVVKGQPIAQIEPTLFQAAVMDAQASVAKARATLENARRQLARAKRLHEQQLMADQDLESAQVTADQAQGDLLSAQAALAKAKANLGYCTIKAPVSGVVVSRAVDVGQTVAASFNTPTLFVIAQDLTKMKVLAAIDEADIGHVRAGEKGQFTVDSFPEDPFRGTVSQVRLEPVVTQNVVTYNVQIDVDNDDLKLRPGMTANVSILTDRRDGVLKLPSAALRFNPLAFMQAGNGDAKSRTNGNGTSSRAGAAPGRGAAARHEDRIWVLKGSRPAPIPVHVGITDGQATEVSGEGLAEGLQVLVGVEEAKKAQQNGATPLGGPMGRR